MDNFDLGQIKNVLEKSKNLSQRSANLWRLIFNLKKRQNFMSQEIL